MFRKLATACVLIALSPDLAASEDHFPPALTESLIMDDHKAASLVLYCPNKDGLQARISLDEPRPNAGQAFSMVFNTLNGEDDIPGFSVTDLQGKTSLVIAYNGSADELVSNLERMPLGGRAQIIFERPAWILQFSLPPGTVSGLYKRYHDFCAKAGSHQ